MAVRKILTISKHEKILRSKSEPVHKINREVKALFDDLRDTMAEHPAIGLAAPQIGAMKRVFIVKIGYTDDENAGDENETAANEASAAESEPRQTTESDDDHLPMLIMVNPEIVQSDGGERGYDACLSIPGMMGYTTRSTTIRIKYLDEQGQKHEQEFSGWDARVIQHELDHLDGILFTDRLASLADLFVLVKDEDGNRKPVPYADVVKGAAKADVPAATNRLRPLLPTAKPG